LARRHAARLVPGDLLLIFFVWYGTTRFLLEFMRSGNWTFFGIPTAQIVSAGFVIVGLVLLWYRHGPGRPAPAAEDPAPPAPASSDGVDATPDRSAGEPGTPAA
jgi:prolipoprotein diacylglyceryltransferase